jgi:hypothetical protein
MHALASTVVARSIAFTSGARMPVGVERQDDIPTRPVERPLRNSWNPQGGKRLYRLSNAG